MDTERTRNQTDRQTTAGRDRLVGLCTLLVVSAIGGDITTPHVVEPATCCDAAAGAPDVAPTPEAGVIGGSDVQDPAPDVVADCTGGLAARLRTADGTAVPGEVFFLMATPGSDAKARLFDQTPHTHNGGTHADTLESNEAAVEVVEAITGADLDRLDLTTAPGGGASGGLAYAITYLNVVTDGAFTGDIRVAATGQLAATGYVQPITGIDEKTAAAHLAEADVLFTPVLPSADTLSMHGTRRVGELFRSRNTGSTIAEERLWEHYSEWGHDRPAGTDLVGVRHIGDVAAYLCGAGSDTACDITRLVGELTADVTPHDVDQAADKTTGDPAPLAAR